MANVIIKVETTVIINTSSSFNAKGREIKRIMDQMMQLIRDLSSVWTGDAAKAYTKKFQGLSDDITRMLKIIDEYVNDLKQIAENYDKAEQDNITLAEQLLDEVIEG
ncbi:MAG TPA: hypothetical protein DF613_09720 [Lachnospiraceae bacterium]|nr:hypothetical protein [Lachnospiraceae bacterium]